MKTLDEIFLAFEPYGKDFGSMTEYRITKVRLEVAKEDILALIEKEKIEARIDELEKVKELDEPADYEQDGKKWTGLAIPRNKIIDRLQKQRLLLNGSKKGDSNV